MAEEIIEETIRVPSNLLGFIRASYDSREKVLDWCLAISLAVVAVWALWPKIGLLKKPAKNLVPSQDVSAALPDVFEQPLPSRIYTYNLPAGRPSALNRGPSVTRRPFNTSPAPQFFPQDDE